MESENSMARATPFVGVHHIGLTVVDADAAARFYVVAAGFSDVTSARQPNLMTSGGRMLRSGNAYIRLLPASRTIALRSVPRPVSDAGIVHICLQSTAVEALYNKFASAGATFHGPLTDLGTGFLYCYARDVENNVIELEGVAPVWEDPAPWVAHVSLTSHDVDRLAMFYAALLGTRATVSGRIGPNRKMDAIPGLAGTEIKAAWIPAANMQIEVIQYLQPATSKPDAPHAIDAPGYGYICLEVSDVAAASQRALAEGATIAVGLSPLHASGDEEFVCTDPDGNVLVLKSFKLNDVSLTLDALSDRDIVARFAARRDQLTNRVH